MTSKNVVKLSSRLIEVGLLGGWLGSRVVSWSRVSANRLHTGLIGMDLQQVSPVAN